MPDCRIYPVSLPFSVRQDPKRHAEAIVYDDLSKTLGRNWLVFYSVAWLLRPGNEAKMADGEADFVVAHPKKGALSIEVKGGGVGFDAKRSQWVSRDRGGVVHDIKNPFEQVKRSKRGLMTKAKSHRSLSKGYLHIYHAVAFPHMYRAEIPETPECNSEIIISREDIGRLDERLAEIFTAHRKNCRHGDELTGPLVTYLENYIAPKMRIANPLGAMLADEERDLLTLTEEQYHILDLLSRERRAVFEGCAGSGKTFLAVEKARRLAGEGFQTALLCYSKHLAKHLRNSLQDLKNLHVRSFEDFCCDAAKALKTTLPKIDSASPEQLDEVYPDVLSKAYKAKPENLYDAIIVDEGQDFRLLWWGALEDCLQPGGLLYVFRDTNQDVYKGDGSLPDRMSGPYPLRQNVRNTKNIFQIVGQVYPGVEDIKPRGPKGAPVEYIKCENPTDIGPCLSKLLTRLTKTDGVRKKDIVVLSPHSVEKGLLTVRVPGFQLCTDEPSGMKNFILCSSVSNFKGLERRVVILAEIDERLPEDQQELRTLLYVALSRACSLLVVVGAQDQLALLK